MVAGIFKAGVESDLSNNLPLSVLHVLFILFEQLVCNRLYDYLNIINKLQIKRQS